MLGPKFLKKLNARAALVAMGGPAQLTQLAFWWVTTLSSTIARNGRTAAVMTLGAREENDKLKNVFERTHALTGNSRISSQYQQRASQRQKRLKSL